MTLRSHSIVRNVLGLHAQRILADSSRFLFEHETYYGVDHSDSSPYMSSCLFQWYGFPAFESLLIQLQPYAEAFAETSLIPTYSYLRIYGNGSSLAAHLDRGACEISITYCVEPEQGYSYPIWIEDYEGNHHEVFLEQGDFMIYRGKELKHWRNAYERNKHTQCFLHYVLDKPENQLLKYDGRPGLGFGPGSKNEPC